MEGNSGADSAPSLSSWSINPDATVLSPDLRPGCWGNVLPLRGNEFDLRPTTDEPIHLLILSTACYQKIFLCNTTDRRNSDQFATWRGWQGATQHCFEMDYSCCAYSNSTQTWVNWNTLPRCRTHSPTTVDASLLGCQTDLAFGSTLYCPLGCHIWCCISKLTFLLDATEDHK